MTMQWIQLPCAKKREIQQHSWDLNKGNWDFISWKKNLTSSEIYVQSDTWADEKCDLSAHSASEKFAIQPDTLL